MKGKKRTRHTLLSAGLLDLLRLADSNQPIVRLELLQGLPRVVNEGESRTLATTILSSKAKDRDLVLVDLVQLREFRA